MIEEQNLLTGSVPKKLAAFAFPLLLANILQSFYNVVDMLVVGQIVGDTGLAAISNASKLCYIINSICIGITMGGAVLIAQYKGANDKKGQAETFQTLAVTSTNPATYFGGTWVAWGSGRVPVGINTSDSNFNTVEKTGGASAVTLTASQMPSHTHTFTGSSTTTNSAGGHTHNIGRDTDGGAGSSRYTVHSAGTSGAQATSPTSSAGAHTHSLTPKGKNANTGGGGSHTNLQPYIVCYMWKRTA